MDYAYPGVFLSYFMFFVLLCLAVYFFLKSRKDGYWGKEGEEIKHRMMDDES
jgi:hypothetical protein